LHKKTGQEQFLLSLFCFFEKNKILRGSALEDFDKWEKETDYVLFLDIKKNDIARSSRLQKFFRLRLFLPLPLIAPI